MAKEGTLYTLLEFIGNPITAMFIAVFVAYYLLGIRQHMGMGAMLTHTEHGFGSIANILLIIGAGGAFNAILKTSGLADSLAHILSNLHMHPILLAWLVALVLHAACRDRVADKLQQGIQRAFLRHIELSEGLHQHQNNRQQHRKRLRCCCRLF